MGLGATIEKKVKEHERSNLKKVLKMYKKKNF